ncbi:hypothetical protein [Brevibacillus dissolubilis]|uniref:hypothetical protein n=1 Tax=Brevibacillus dissolubilis TaxID=1844116 RepID=UPI00210021FA|nr:hypothetical protein [Brevibacillus dissolubilis]
MAGCTGQTTPASTSGDEKGKEGGSQAYNVTKTNHTFDTAGNMFAYAEFELSGEPLAETLGLDLDLLDVGKLDSPTPFDYTAGVESYEYSEEALYEVVEKSGLGLHLANGPVNLKRAGSGDGREALAKRYFELADAVGYAPDEIFQNMFPTYLEYSSGDPHYITKVDTSKFADGEDGKYIPKYQVDYGTLRWDRSKMDKTLTPSALGGTFLKQALWLGDFMGGLHTVDKDEELEATSATQDSDANIRLGVSSADGLQGVFLTEGVWNKLSFIRDNLFISAKDGKLGATAGTKYDPAKGLVYLPHAVQVIENGDEQFPAVKELRVTDKRSLLQDQWLMMWAASEFYGTTDQRPANPNKNPAFLALFDGKPFPSAPAANLDADTANDVKADDPYSLNRDVLYTLFANMEAMHWNAQEGTLVQEHSGEANGQGNTVDTFQAGYSIEALRLFVRAVDGLPLGYANGDAAEGLHTPEGEKALSMIKKQADFIMTKLIDEKDGLVANSYTIGTGKKEESKALPAQLGAIRGLNAAFLATKDEKYRDAARKLYDTVFTRFWDEKASAFRDTADKVDDYTYDSFQAGAVSAALRIGMLNLVNTDADKDKYTSLELGKLTDTYTRFYRNVINGPTLEQGMQTSEFWDTGDAYLEKTDKAKEGNTDGDTVPQIQAAGGPNGIAPVLVPVVIKQAK